MRAILCNHSHLYVLPRVLYAPAGLAAVSLLRFMKRSPLIILFITIFIDLLGFGLVLPLLPIYIQHYGGKPWVGGMLLACFSTMQFIFSPIWGRASDRFGRRPLILLSLFGSAISFIAFGSARTLLILFVARISAGILSAASLPAAYAYIADVTPPEKRSSGMALIGAAFGLGFALGPAISGPLSQHPILGIPPLAMPAYFAALLCLINFVWAIFNLPETHTERSEHSESKGAMDIFAGISRALKDPAVQYQLTVFAFTTFAFTAVESSFSWLTLLRFKADIESVALATWHSYGHLPFASVPLEVRRLIPAGVAWPQYGFQNFGAIDLPIATLLREKAEAAINTRIFMIVGITILFVQVAVMRGVAARVGEKRLIVAGALILTVTLFGIAMAQSLLWIEILSAFIAIGNGILNPCLSSLISQAASRSNRGTVSGAQQGIGSLARIVAPPINNYMVGVNTAIPFIASGCLMSVALALSIRLKQPRADESESYPVAPRNTTTSTGAPADVPSSE